MIRPERDVHHRGPPSALKAPGSHHVPELEQASLLAKSDMRQLLKVWSLKRESCKQRYLWHTMTTLELFYNIFTDIFYDIFTLHIGMLQEMLVMRIILEEKKDYS